LQYIKTYKPIKIDTLSIKNKRRKRGMKRCIYCGTPIEDKSVIDFCEKCGVGVFGPKMFNAIVQNMQEAERRGDLQQG